MSVISSWLKVLFSSTVLTDFFYPLHLSYSDRGVLKSPSRNSRSFYFSLQFFHFLPPIVSPSVKATHFRDC